MPVTINDSCLESLSDISIQNEDWIVQQAIVLLERRVFKAGPRFERPAAVIFAHQHPSGTTEPSNADRVLTEQLKTALALIDVRVLDHFVIGQGAPYSFAESGLL